MLNAIMPFIFFYSLSPSVWWSGNLLLILLLLFFNTDQGRLTGLPLKTTAYPPGVACEKKKRYVHIIIHNNALEKCCVVQDFLFVSHKWWQTACKLRCVAGKVSTAQILYLWNWILRRCWCFIPPKIRQGPTFCYSIHPKAVIKLAFVRIVELSITVLLAISPGAFIPISTCLDTTWKVKF